MGRLFNGKMCYCLIWTMCLSGLSTAGLNAQNSTATQVYINTFRDISVREMARTGIPASIKLAQGILESGNGRSELAINANNHFGIKCGGDWTGSTYALHDDDYDLAGALMKSCFRVYLDAEESYIAHSEFLRNPNKNSRYGFLFTLDPTDYKSWAKGLKSAGYATNPKYADLLISTIERNKLYELDLLTPGDIIASADGAKPVPPAYNKNEVRNQGKLNKLTLINDVKVIIVRDGSSLLDLATQYDVSVKRLHVYNENIKSTSASLDKGAKVFLQPRRNGYRGRNKWHYVKTGENIASIAEEYAIKESSLMRRNQLKAGEEPAIGQRIALRGTGMFIKKPVLRSQTKSTLPKKQEKQSKPDPDHHDLTSPDKPIAHAGKSSTGQTASVPSAKPVDKNTDPGTFHRVEKGDTLYNLSVKYQTTVDTIKTLNHLDSTDIKVGQEVRVK